MIRQFMMSMVVITVAVAAMASAEADDTAVVREAWSRLNTQLESIDRFECRSSASVTRDGRTVIANGSYLRDGKRELWRCPRPGGMPHTSFTDGVIVRRLHAPALGFLTTYDRAFDPHDPWTATRFREVGPMANLLSRGTAGKQYAGWTARESANIAGSGRPGLVVTHQRKSLSPNVTGLVDEYELDAGYNYLPVRMVSRTTYKGRSGTGEWLFKDVREVNPGVYFPTRVEQTERFAAPDEVTQSATATFTDIKVNHKLSTAVDITFPKGMHVVDAIKNVDFTAGADGNPDGPVRKRGKPAVPTVVK